MSGHSKWANIRVRKTVQDARRGKIAARHARLVEIAARAGGGDPMTNSTLRTAIENARTDEVPKENIERAIKKGIGELKGERMAEVLYAAMGPGGVAYLIECLTDNRNRTIANVKSVIGRHGGNFAELGAVQWMFERKGLVIGQGKKGKESKGGLEELELALIDLGAEDITFDEGIVRVVTGLANWGKVRDVLKEQGFEVLSAGLSYIPIRSVVIRDSGVSEQIQKFLDAIEADDDVAQVYTNAEIL